MDGIDTIQKRFTLRKQFPLIIADDFSWKDFVKNNGHNFFSGIQICDPLQPKDLAGKKYITHLYEIIRVEDGEWGVPSEDCIEFIKSKNGILPNADGLAAIWLFGKEHLPEWDYIMAFDEEKNLPDAYPCNFVPYIRNVPHGWLFGGRGFDDLWFDGYHIVFFTKQ